MTFICDDFCFKSWLDVATEWLFVTKSNRVSFTKLIYNYLDVFITLKFYSQQFLRFVIKLIIFFKVWVRWQKSGILVFLLFIFVFSSNKFCLFWCIFSSILCFTLPKFLFTLCCSFLFIMWLSKWAYIWRTTL